MQPFRPTWQRIQNEIGMLTLAVPAKVTWPQLSSTNDVQTSSIPLMMTVHASIDKPIYVAALCKYRIAYLYYFPVRVPTARDQCRACVYYERTAC